MTGVPYNFFSGYKSIVKTSKSSFQGASVCVCLIWLGFDSCFFSSLPSPQELLRHVTING